MTSRKPSAGMVLRHIAALVVGLPDEKITSVVLTAGEVIVVIRGADAVVVR